jgi:hypothetical protein
MLCLATVALGFDVGWQRLPEGGMTYIIQLDPQTLETLRAGQPIESDIPPSAGEIRFCRVVVGTAKLPRETPAAPSPPPKPAERKEPPVDQLGTAASGKTPPSTTAEVQPEQPAKPWLPLTFTLLGLFASLGTNVYLGWIAWDSGQRWRAKISA